MLCIFDIQVYQIDGRAVFTVLGQVPCKVIQGDRSSLTVIQREKL